MNYKHFRVQVVTRVLLLSASLYLLYYLLQHAKYPATTLVLGLVIAYQIYALIHFVERTNRDLSRFFLSIKHADFSQTYVTGGLGSAFDELKRAFNEVLDSFRSARADSEEQARYLHTVVQHIGIGLIAFDSEGRVELINTAAKRLLRISRLRHIADLETKSAELLETMRHAGPGQKSVVTIEEANEIVQLVLFATVFRLREKEFTLISLQNIQTELEEKEMESWQNLIRVLTHEIMNSITPISSLASTAAGLLNADSGQPEDLSDVRDAVQTIHRRSEGLLHFVDAYRDLTRIPQPDFQIVRVSEVIARVGQLMSGEIESAAIRLTTSVDPEPLEVTIDTELTDQVMINLVRNALEALEAQPDAALEIRGQMAARGQVIIEITDNGPGIVEEAVDKIFIPFYTTKQSGSGIGLSLCRQIMRVQGGGITARSKPGETVFTLRF